MIVGSDLSTQQESNSAEVLTRTKKSAMSPKKIKSAADDPQRAEEGHAHPRTTFSGPLTVANTRSQQKNTAPIREQTKREKSCGATKEVKNTALREERTSLGVEKEVTDHENVQATEAFRGGRKRRKGRPAKRPPSHRGKSGVHNSSPERAVVRLNIQSKADAE